MGIIWLYQFCIRKILFFQDETYWCFALLVLSHQSLYPSTQPYIVMFSLDTGLSISLLILQHHLFGSYVQPCLQLHLCTNVWITLKCLSPSSLVLFSFSHNLLVFLHYDRNQGQLLHHPSPHTHSLPFSVLHLNSLYHSLLHLLHFLSICHFQLVIMIS